MPLLVLIVLSIDLFYDARYAHTRMVNPDFIALAKSMRVHAIRCHSAEELPAKMKELLEYPEDKPVLLECLVSRTEHVFPMVCASPAYALPLAYPACRYPRAKPSTSRCSTQNFGNPK